MDIIHIYYFIKKYNNSINEINKINNIMVNKK